MGTSRTDTDGGHVQFQHDELFVATVTEPDDCEPVCTISQVPVTERLLLSEWVCAEGDSFVTLEEMR